MNTRGKSGGAIATIYPGTNESEDFKVPSKLPTFMLYKKGGSLNDGPVQLDRMELLKSMTTSGKINPKKFDKILKDFIKKNSHAD